MAAQRAVGGLKPVDVLHYAIQELGHSQTELADIQVMRGKKGLSMAMVRRLRARFRVPADLLLPSPKKSPPRRSTKRAAA